MPDIGRREVLEKSSKATVGAGLAGLAGCLGDSGDGGDSGGGDGSDGGSSSSEPVTLGAAISKSGQLAANGKAFSDGYNAFVRWLNEENGGLNVGGETREVELIEYDDESNCETAVRLVTRLIEEDDADIILGPYSSGCVYATVPAVKQRNKVMIQGSGIADRIFEDHNQDNVWVFGTTPPASLYIQGSVAFPAENGAESLGMFSDQGTFAQSLRAGAKAEAERQGMEILVDETVPQDARDLSSPIQKMVDAEPDFVMFNTHLELSVLAQRAAKEQGLSPELVYGGSGVSETEYWDALGGDALDTNYYTTWSPEIEISGNPPFMGNQQAIEFYGGYAEGSDSLDPVSSRRISGMQVIQVAAWAIEEAGTTDNDAIREALLSADFTGIFGVDINFQDDGTLQQGGFTGQIQGKTEQPIVYPGNVATGEPTYPRRPWDHDVRQQE
ncbi:MAG: amino acid ABC transporter substrate-binding protein [Haloarcula sp.]